MRINTERNITKYFLICSIITIVIGYVIINTQSSYKKIGIIEGKNPNNTFIAVEIKKQLNIDDLYSLANEIYTDITNKKLYNTKNIVICFTDDKEYASFPNINNLTTKDIESKFILGNVAFNKTKNMIEPEIKNNLNKIDWSLKPTTDEYERYNDFKTYLNANKEYSVELDHNLNLTPEDYKVLEIKFKTNKIKIKDLIDKIESWRDNNIQNKETNEIYYMI